MTFEDINNIRHIIFADGVLSRFVQLKSKLGFSLPKPHHGDDRYDLQEQSCHYCGPAFWVKWS